MIRQTHLSGSAAKVASYFESKFSERENRKGETIAEGYYSMEGGAPSEWFGKGAERQGLAGAVNKEDAIRALSGFVASTGEDISSRGGQTADSRRMGEELTIAAPKSVSIMSAEDPRIAEAHQAAVREALGYIESEMVHARIGKGGRKGNEFTNNMTAAVYLHEDARDSKSGRVAPHLHSHCVIANMTQRSDGTWTSLKLDWGHNNQKKMTADDIYKSALAKNLKELGYEIEKGKGSNFEIAGITREQIEYFSPRSQDIKAEIGGDRDCVSAKEREAAQNLTKGRKSKLDHVAQRFEWRKQMREIGLDASAIRQSAEARAAREQSSQNAITGEMAVQSAIRNLSERNATFSKEALTSEALAAGLGEIGHREIEQAIENRAGGLVSAGKGEGLKSEAFTTKSEVFKEAEILHRVKEGKGKAESLITEDEQQEVTSSSFEKEIANGKRTTLRQKAIDGIAGIKSLAGHMLQRLSQRHLDADAQRQGASVLSGNEGAGGSGHEGLRRNDDRLAGRRVEQIIDAREKQQGFGFSQGQRAAVALALTSTDQHIGIVGAAGAGKTTAMAAIVEQYKQAGYSVIGVAPSAAAAKELESAGCDETKTLAKLLSEKPQETGANTLYILDEAGMVSSKDFDKFLRKADNENARTLSVGDPRQLQSVESGIAFKQLLETGTLAHVRIDEIQRQKDPQLRQIAQEFARGNASRGVELAKPYMQQVNIEKGADKLDALSSAAANAYLALSSDERAKTLLLAGTNATRQAINSKIRQGLVGEKALGDRAETITALDKLDLTKEGSTLAENYASMDGAQVVVSFARDYKEKDENGNNKTIGERGTQWDVIDNASGKLTLQSRDDPAKTLEINPHKAKLSAFVAREIELRSGDQIVFRQNDREKGITNGTLATIQIAENGAITARTKAGQEIPIAKNKAQVIDYSYARTVHSSQGATVERAIVIGEASRVATAEAAYVACSREKTGLQIITDDTERLGKSWEKFSDRQTALEAARDQLRAPESLEEIQAARQAVGKEVGSIGDLAQARASGQVTGDLPSQQQEQQQEQKIGQAVAGGRDPVEAKEAAERGDDPSVEAEAHQQEQEQELEAEAELEAG